MVEGRNVHGPLRRLPADRLSDRQDAMHVVPATRRTTVSASRMKPSGESIRVVHPLFHTGRSGSSPTSPLQLTLRWISPQLGVSLNELWHSRLPNFTAPLGRYEAIGAEHQGIFYAVAIWSWPVSRMLCRVQNEYYELRRLAIAADAPKNTASRMLRVMRLMIRRDKPLVRNLISYQDTDVHTGTIYRAAGWASVRKSAAEEWTRPSRARQKAQSAAAKIRWQIPTGCSPPQRADDAT